MDSIKLLSMRIVKYKKLIGTDVVMATSLQYVYLLHNCSMILLQKETAIHLVIKPYSIANYTVIILEMVYHRK